MYIHITRNTPQTNFNFPLLSDTHVTKWARQFRVHTHMAHKSMTHAPLLSAHPGFFFQLNTSHCLRMLPRLPDLTPTRPSLTMASAKAL